MKRLSPDAGRRRARRRHDGAVADLMPICAAGVLAAATMAMVTIAAPATLLALHDAQADHAACHPRIEAARDGVRG